MKRIYLYISILMLMFLLIGCADKNTEQMSDIIEDQESVSTQTPVTLVAMAEWAEFETFSDVKNKYENIIYAKVIKVLPSIRIDKVKHGIVSGKEEEWQNITSYNVEVIEALQGTYKPGDIIRIDQNGGTVGNRTELIEDAPFLKEGSEYIICIYEPEQLKKSEYFSKALPDPLDGYVEVVDGVLIPHKLSRFYKEGMTLDEFKAMLNSE